MLPGCLMSLIRIIYLKIKSLITGKPTPWSKENPRNKPTSVQAEAEKYPNSIAVIETEIFNSKLFFDEKEVYIRDIEEAEKVGQSSDTNNSILKVRMQDGQVYIFEATDKMYSRINMKVGIPN